MRRIDMQERPGWIALADSVGFTYHHTDGQRYWDERAAYQFTLTQVEDDIEAVAANLHGLCLELVDEVVASDALMQRLQIPQGVRDYVAASWQAAEPSLYGRFDLAYDGRGPAKLYEYNADTPTSVYEAAVFQWLWLEDAIGSRALPPQADQFNSLHEALLERFGQLFAPGAFLHFAGDADAVEDRQTVLYLEDLAGQALLDPHFVAIDDIGLDADGRFIDAEGHIIQEMFKLYPWEDMVREPFAADLARSGTRFLEPPWKAILSNKGLLPLLWERHPDHPNLLPAYFEDDPRARILGDSFVRKPLFSREGANIEVRDRRHRVPILDQGYGGEGHIWQAFHPLPDFGGVYPVIGAWIVGDTPAGMGLREDSTLVTKSRSRFVPHVILD